jgi:hypothetical protein
MNEKIIKNPYREIPEERIDKCDFTDEKSLKKLLFKQTWKLQMSHLYTHINSVKFVWSRGSRKTVACYDSSDSNGEDFIRRLKLNLIEIFKLDRLMDKLLKIDDEDEDKRSWKSLCDKLNK